MALKKFSKYFNRWLARQSLYLCSLTVKFLPKSWLCGFAELVAVLGYYIASKQRKIALESLGIAFGSSLSRKDKIKIAKDCFRNMAKSGVELLYVLEKSELSNDLVDIEGKDYLEAALSKSKGVIVVSAHFGNFPLALIRLGQEGYKLNVILRRMRDERVDDFLSERRQRAGVQSIYTTPRPACVENSLKSLRNNELLFIQLDQNFGTSGIFVNFFGRQAATATGPVVLALRTEATIVPLFIVRQSDNRHKIFIEPEVMIEKKNTQDETLQFNTQKITSLIESFIRKSPAEWGWIHRRWKSRPSS
ncbi:MAG: hypothetical protein A3J51_05970 [Omnitrophica WOR_2 bacterium RIFCSPHIGHO2_02_FULL_45_21]|nr:MAG: hypothetical protein A3J51_05970 [Omnitrophica WOR_2 bacterium RIFCSPHIGHO2_02_FULL_45_21]